MGGLGQISNKNKVPMNQMSSTPSSNTNNLLSFNATANQPAWNNTNKNGQDKTVSLSAQEINDFLT